MSQVKNITRTLLSTPKPKFTWLSKAGVTRSNRAINISRLGVMIGLLNDWTNHDTWPWKIDNTVWSCDTCLRNRCTFPVSIQSEWKRSKWKANPGYPTVLPCSICYGLLIIYYLSGFSGTILLLFFQERVLHFLVSLWKQRNYKKKDKYICEQRKHLNNLIIFLIFQRNKQLLWWLALSTVWIWIIFSLKE